MQGELNNHAAHGIASPLAFPVSESAAAAVVSDLHSENYLCFRTAYLPAQLSSLD